MNATNKPVMPGAEHLSGRADSVEIAVELILKREHPVIVEARNYREAHLLARADPTIASFGTDISAFELSRPRMEAALTEGAIDLRDRTSAPPILSSLASREICR